MSRESMDQVKYGRVWNGYDYNLQVWVQEGVVVPCAHPEQLRRMTGKCCNSFVLAGMSIYGLKDAEDRIEEYGEEE